MKIGFDAKRIFYNQTGLGNYARSLVHSLLENFPEHSYHLYSPGMRIEQDFLAQSPQVYRHFPKSTFHRKFPSLWRSAHLSSELKEDGIDIFHGLSNELPKGIENSGSKSVVSIHDLIFLHYPGQYPWLDRQIYKRKFASAIKRANRVVAMSEQTKADILDCYGIEASKVQVIYQNCDPAFSQKADAAFIQELRRKYELRRDFIICVGTLETRKNHLNLLRAYVESELNDTDLLIIGRKAGAYPALEQFVNKQGLQSRVKFLDKLPFAELPALYQASVGSAYISTYEGFGIPILEAMRSGVPVLGSNISSIPEVAGDAAVLVNPMDVSEIARGLNKLIFDSSLRNHLSEKAKWQVQKFEPKALSRQLMDLYQGLAG